ncbi:MAG: FAD-dependent oxidoreductase, partial [Pseudomonadota bacterium]
VGYLRTNWSRDPFSFGSYSYLAKGSSALDRATLAEPVNQQVFFAGEAANPPYEGTVHAAHESGHRVAQEIWAAGYTSVGIIGAGISGLTAAHALSNQGVDVSIFEARSRIGGRIWTDNTLGVPLDLGGSWIHGDEGNPLVALAQQTSAETKATDESYIIRGEGGRRLRWWSTPDWLETVVSYEQSTGADYDAVDWDGYGRQDDYEGDDLLFPGGYSQILNAFSGEYQIAFEQAIERVRIRQDGVSLHGASGRLGDFDGVIVTVPLGVLKQGKLAFEPPLPVEKQDALARMRMGTLDKLYLRFDEVFWDADATWILTPETGLPRGQFNQWLNLSPYLGEPIIMAFNGASAALELADLSDEALLGRALQVLNSAYPQ